MRTSKGIMHKNVITITPDESLLLAYKLMKEHDIRHLPVLGPDRKLVGILSDRDIQRAMISKKISDFQQETKIAEDIKVSDFMTWPVFTVSENTHLNLVAEMMLKQKVSALIVENDQGYVSGIVTTNDLLAYLLQVVNTVETTQKWPLSYYLY